MWELLQRLFTARDQVHDHTYYLVPNFNFSSGDFYGSIEKELLARKVPGLDISRIELSEGGLLSDNREYLRLKRERLVFDICAAPFGTNYFFSFRFVELPVVIKPLDLLAFLIGLVVFFALLAKLLGTIWGFITLIVLLGFSMWIARNAIALGLKDLDASLLKTPVIAPLYEIFLRKETYYREDTRLMYLTTVREINQRLVEDVTAAKGIKLLKRHERKPLDLYQIRTDRSDGADAAL